MELINPGGIIETASGLRDWIIFSGISTRDSGANGFVIMEMT